MNVKNGAQADLSSTTARTVTGTGGDLKVGGNTAVTWGTFDGASNEVDATVELARAYK